MHFLVNVGRRNRIVFGNVELSIQRLRSSFVCNLWSWAKGFIYKGPLTLISFLDRVGSG